MEMKRLYVGGLGHSVTDKDLRDRFGKFGKVEDVELKTRTDDRGVPYKTFGYINITISDPELKKCLSVLNKSQWKGGTLQIETAKESFLQRLRQEREDWAQLAQTPPGPSSQQKLLESLKDAGVSNFTMKSAVPGTEIPGHKDWVVGKFGRVLPVLQLKCRRGDRVKTLKYDPSKYGHNLRALAPPPGPEDTPTPVSQLTWAIEGGDDDMSRKRRGEFPPFTSKKKRKENRPSSDLIGFCNGSGRPIRALRPPLDSESEEELRRIENGSHNPLGPEDDTLEVVSSDYTHRKNDDDGDSADTDELFSSRKPQTNRNKTAPEKKRKKQNGRRSKYDSTDEDDDEEEEEDSGKERKKVQKVTKSDKTDDAKKVQLRDDKTEEKERVKGRGQEDKEGRKERTEETNQGSKERTEETNQGSKERTEERNLGGTERKEEMNQGSKEMRKEINQGGMELTEETNEGDEETDQGYEEDDSDSESDPDYESLFSNVVQLEMSLSDLQTLAQKFAPEGSTPTPRILSVDDVGASPKKGTTPEEILASILEGGSSDEDEDEEEEERRKERRSKRKKRSAPVMSLPAFRGTKELEPEKKEEKKETGGEREEEEEEEEAKSSGEEERDEESSAQSESSSDEEEEEEEEEDDEDCSESSSEDEEDEDESQPMGAGADLPTANQRRPAPEEEAELQRRANERRLAAVHQRQKEAELNRKLIQGALSKLDAAPGGSGGKHIVFGSEEEDEEEEEEPQETQETQETQEQLSANQSKASSAPRLFDSDEDEDEDEEEEEEKEKERFEIRPEFEGAAGHKLMALQSRFGTDERFKMDARFLDDAADGEEEEEEAGSGGAGAAGDQQEALEQEKLKNLSILQSVLGPGAASTRPAGGSRAKAQTFRDVSALHYDPSKDEHAAFERKPPEPKESKASRRKRREEAQKLPEVSSEMFFEVSADLKVVFGKETENQVKKDEEEEKNWDQEEGGDEERGDEERGDEERGDEERGEETEKEESGGFKFSFFGDEPEPEPQQTEYKVQSILAPKLSWQQDPRLNDSSEEEEEEERGGEEEEEEEEEEERTAPEESTEASSSLFFFSSGDPRLTDGPRWFCRTSLEEQRETWDQTRTQLRQDCKKKHKDARRKLRAPR